MGSVLELEDYQCRLSSSEHSKTSSIKPEVYHAAQQARLHS
jgi:hypothetical protein